MCEPKSINSRSVLTGEHLHVVHIGSLIPQYYSVAPSVPVFLLPSGGGACWGCGCSVIVVVEVGNGVVVQVMVVVGVVFWWWFLWWWWWCVAVLPLVCNEVFPCCCRSVVRDK